MKKNTKIKLFISSLFFILSFIFMSQVYAATLTLTNLTANSVTLNSVGLNPYGVYTFRVIGPAVGSLTKDDTVDETGTISINFDQLVAGENYTASVALWSPGQNALVSAGTPLVHFSTLDASMVADKVTDTTATIKAIGLLQNYNSYKFILSGPSGTSEQNKSSDQKGTIEDAHFSNLTPSTDYTVQLYKVDKITNHSKDAGVPILHFLTSASVGTDPTKDPDPTLNPDPISTNTTDTEIGVDQAFIDGKSLVPCGNDRAEERRDANGKEIFEEFLDPATGKVTPGSRSILHPCTFDHLILVINRVINSILFVFAVPIAAIMFAYAGFLLLFSGGEPSKKTKAKNIFTNVVIGLIFVAGAWLVIHTIFSVLGYDGSWIGF